MLKVGIIDKRPGKGLEVLHCDDLEKAIETVQSLNLSLKSDEAQALIFLSVFYFSFYQKISSVEQIEGAQYCGSQVGIYVAEVVY